MSAVASARTPVGGPFFEQLEVGQTIATAPAMTLTEGHAAVHQAILGDRLRLPLDATLSAAVSGEERPLAHPGLVCDVAIGQSTLITQRVIANLFYRGLVLRRQPRIGDTLRTTVEVGALRQNSSRPGRPGSGMAALRVRTVDQEERLVLDFWRCAMLQLADPEAETGRADDLDLISAEIDLDAVRSSLAGWRLDAYRELVPGPHFGDLEPGERWSISAGDVVSAAPELARLTLNLAMAHHDADASGRGRRLVYGGQTIGLAAAQVSRALPGLVTYAAWHACDHLGPVFEYDTLYSEVELERTEALPEGGGLAHLTVTTSARREGQDTEVLRWRPVAVMA